jgi:DNA-binding HxlR family transcriptional regulator
MKMTKKECGVTKAMRLIGAKWTLSIIHALCEKEKRFNQLLVELSPISPRTLSLRLKQLEKDGIVSKKIFAEIPLHVEYRLTKKGSSLKEIVMKMEDWGRQQE